jgi:methionyl-tRNA synthetase
MIRARQEGRSEEALIAEMNGLHQQDFAGFQIQFDNYGSTNSDENRELCAVIWKKLREADLITEREVEQLYDPVENTFLADRFVKGKCPNCKSPDQYGDNCDKCGAAYAAADLIEPYSTLSKATPELKPARHWFIQLEKLHSFVEQWSQSGEHLQTEVANYLKGHFLGQPLKDWDVTRPAKYFGFEIPDAPGNYWYVWFVAPIGYIASLWQWCKANGEKLEDWWPTGPDAEARGPEIHHFIGKDITYFHTLFWPGMLKAARFKLPEKVHIHGFLTVDGEKMSKSKGTFVKASTYLKHLDPAWLRYYYASKLGPRLDDLDLAVDEFVNKVNADLVGKVVNIASRTAKFVQAKGLAKAWPSEVDSDKLFEQAAKEGEAIAAAYEECNFAQAVRLIMAQADRANVFIDKFEPWKLNKQPDKAQLLQDVCTVALNLFRQIVTYLAPVQPLLAEQAGKLLNEPLTSWDATQRPLLGTAVAPFSHMMKRVEKKDIEAMIEES